MKLAAVNRTVNSPVAVDATEESLPEDGGIIIGRESGPPYSPPPYSTPSTHPHKPSEGPPHLKVPGCMCEMLLRWRMFTHTPISRVSRDIRPSQRQASTVQRNRPPGPKFMIPLPAEY
jgi:hypothetical protein